MIIYTFIIFVIVVTLCIKFAWAFRQQNCRSKVFLGGKCAVVTGGSNGIGYEIVLGLASRGCKVIIADCVVDESIKDKIYKETHNPNIILKYVNLAAFQSVRKFAQELRNTEEKVDILVNNAGVAGGAYALTEDGLNYTLQVNYYSAFLLTHLLIDLLKKSDYGGRIIFTTSLLAFIHTLTAENIKESGLETGDEFHSYQNSKFSQICASGIFAEKLKNDGVTSNCFHPYISKTSILTKKLEGSSWSVTLAMIFLKFFSLILGKTAEEAAQSGIYLACANEAKGVTGGFFGHMKPTFKPLRTRDPSLMKTLWEHSERQVELKPEEKIK